MKSMRAMRPPRLGQHCVLAEKVCLLKLLHVGQVAQTVKPIKRKKPVRGDVKCRVRRAAGGPPRLGHRCARPQWCRG